MPEVTKRDNEGPESVVRRFSQMVHRSGTLLEAKRRQFHERNKSRKEARKDAQRKAEIQSERDHLIKIGEIDEFAPYKPGKHKRNK